MADTQTLDQWRDTQAVLLQKEIPGADTTAIGEIIQRYITKNSLVGDQPHASTVTADVVTDYKLSNYEVDVSATIVVTFKTNTVYYDEGGVGIETAVLPKVTEIIERKMAKSGMDFSISGQPVITASQSDGSTDFDAVDAMSKTFPTMAAAHTWSVADTVMSPTDEGHTNVVLTTTTTTEMVIMTFDNTTGVLIHGVVTSA